MQTLKCCPFCNGPAEIAEDCGSFFARCVNSACPPATQTPLVGDTDTAANDWNTRPSALVEGLVKTCDGKEQLAFEEWANSNHFDMHEHPMHYLFMDKETNAARKGWREAIRYCHEQAEAIIAAERSENEALKAGIKRLSDEQELLSETSDVDLISVVKLAARLSEAEADNAVLTARVKELELIRDSHSQDTLQALQGQQALETQLAAAREGVKYALANLRMSKRNEEFLASALQWSEPTAPCDANALEDRP